MKVHKIGLDVHGVIDKYPQEFALLTRRWVNVCGYEVHILTGSSWVEAEKQIKEIGIHHTHHLSIVDYNREIGTPMILKPTGWWMDDLHWDRTKGEYAKREFLDVHFEDTLRYATWFPPSCTFVHVGDNFGESLKVVGDFLHAFDLMRV